jgi:hypothetical protein
MQLQVILLILAGGLPPGDQLRMELPAQGKIRPRQEQLVQIDGRNAPQSGKHLRDGQGESYQTQQVQCGIGINQEYEMGAFHLPNLLTQITLKRHFKKGSI